MSGYSVPERDALRWEVERADIRQPAPRGSGWMLVGIAVSLALLCVVAYRLVDQFVRW